MRRRHCLANVPRRAGQAYCTPLPSCPAAVLDLAWIDRAREGAMKYIKRRYQLAPHSRDTRAACNFQLCRNKKDNTVLQEWLDPRACSHWCQRIVTISTHQQGHTLTVRHISRRGRANPQRVPFDVARQLPALPPVQAFGRAYRHTERK